MSDLPDGQLVVVSGTGTGVGKTHFARALLRHLRSRQEGTFSGFKPIESGVAGTEGEDGRWLREESFHVKQPEQVYVFPEALSPHLAARRAHVEIDIDRVLTAVTELRRASRHVVVELAGGLFTPLTDRLTNGDLATRLEATALVLVAPDRLGVLHDVLATARAALSAGLVIHATVLTAPERPDASTGTNRAELARMTAIPTFGPLPRATPEELATTAELFDIQALLSSCRASVRSLPRSSMK